MNISKSVKIALAKNEKSMIWLAEQLGVTRQQASVLANKNGLNTKNIEKLAAAFDMKVSEFIALGE